MGSCGVCAFQDLNAAAGATAGEVAPPSDYLILTIGDASRHNSTAGSYRWNDAAWRCYGNRYGVPVRNIDPKDVPGCPQSTTHFDWFFARLCVVSTVVDNFLKLGKDGRSIGASELGLANSPKWVFHFDGDSVAFNGDLPLSALTQHWAPHKLVFYERFRNGEIMAGNYALQVSRTASRFMRGWAALRPIANQSNFSNGDNGALHVHMVEFLKDELPISRASATAVVNRLYSHWREAHNLISYDRYVAAAKLALGRRRLFSNVLIQRRGHAFCIDKDMYGGAVNMLQSNGSFAARFLCIHGLKTAERMVKDVGQDCVSSVERCSSSLLTCPTKVSRFSDAQLVEAVRAQNATDRKGLGVNDVRECWPDCPPEIPAETWAHMRLVLEANAK